MHGARQAIAPTLVTHRSPQTNRRETMKEELVARPVAAGPWRPANELMAGGWPWPCVRPAFVFDNDEGWAGHPLRITHRVVVCWHPVDHQANRIDPRYSRMDPTVPQGIGSPPTLLGVDIGKGARADSIGESDDDNDHDDLNLDQCTIAPRDRR
ncbi:uncharacterized protein PFL1_03202 [Pseudozyma flocculosa PF-1]|uniref:Uncharacterized protein n=1 Tax=Pseudozyma flocculosa PF-1 TaxID=1277687 RepID=A0A061H968_9BASI|nr:uncharacterized protein PFL1_03202 [Pseudozyma flocculosa PF-1]EPQ29447.1 hypothetical protein PFL1_03202 [Pseudozyma flocculosa PF-1]